MNNLAIVTRADSRINEMSKLTHPLLKKYASKCNADFIILSENIKGLHPHWRIFNCQKLLDNYDRILMIDTDALVLPTCPNIFNIVEFSSIGTVLEDKGSRKEIRRQRIKMIQNKLGDVGWTEGYINTGVFVFSKEHRRILEYKVEDLPVGDETGVDDAYIGYQIHKHGFKVFELPFKFNHMSMFSEDGTSRWDSYIIHAAGMGFFPLIKRTELIKQDIILLRKYYGI